MNTPKTDDGTPLSPPPCSAFARSEFTVTQRSRAEDALHFAHKHEQRVWGNGSDHEKAHAEVERLEAILASWPNNVNVLARGESATSIIPKPQ
jgi:hypothetical protein